MLLYFDGTEIIVIAYRRGWKLHRTTNCDNLLWNLDAWSILLDLSLYSFNDCNCSFSLGESASQSFTCDQNDRSQITSDKRPRAGPWNVQWRHCRDFIIRGTEKTWRGKRSKPTYHMIGGAYLWYAGWPLVCFGSVCFKDFWQIAKFSWNFRESAL